VDQIPPALHKKLELMSPQGGRW